MAIAQSRPTAGYVPRVLVVDDEPVLFELFRDAVAGEIDCQIIGACNLGEARKVLARQGIDLLVTDVLLPDGNGLSLLGELHEKQPVASAVVMTGAANMDLAIQAIQQGAVDFMPKPFSAEHLTASVRKALDGQLARARQERRMHKLRTAYKRLNAARRLVSKKVDLLCGDLIGAYAQMARQFDTVRLQQGFREFITQATGLEQLLCHTMDWLLRQVGYCNIGIWLASSDDQLQLGAYMKYTVPGERALTSAMEDNLLKVVMRRGFIRLREGELEEHLSPAEKKFLSTQEIVGINCQYLGDALGAMVMFRDVRTPFSEDDVAALKTITPLFSLALTRAAHSGLGGLDEEDQPPDKRDEADWWKSGQEPPF